MTPHIFKTAHEAMRRAARGASVALQLEADGYVALGPDAEKVAQALGKQVTPVTLLDDFRQVTLPLPSMAEAVNSLTAAGHSVALLDRHQTDWKEKPRVVLVCTVPAQQTNDWC